MNYQTKHCIETKLEKNKPNMRVRKVGQLQRAMKKPEVLLVDYNTEKELIRGRLERYDIDDRHPKDGFYIDNGIISKQVKVNSVMKIALSDQRARVYISV